MDGVCLMDTRGFEGFVKSLANVAGGISTREATRLATGKVLSTCARYQAQRLPSKSKMQADKAERVEAKAHTVSQDGVGSVPFREGTQTFEPASGPRISIGTGAKCGTARTWVGQPGKWYLTTNKLSPEIQAMADSLAAMQEARSAQLKAIARTAIDTSYGLSVRSWLDIGDKLGVPVKPPGKGANARPSDGKTYDNASAEEAVQGESFYIDIANSSPVTIAREGEAVLQSAINASIKQFGIDLRTGVFEDIALRAKRWPGVFVQ